MSQELAHICELIYNFENDDCDTREKATNEYMDLEKSSPDQVIQCLLAICHDHPDILKSHAILRILSIFRQNSLETSLQSYVSGQLWELLDINPRLNHTIISTICDCLPAIAEGTMSVDSKMYERFNELAHRQFSLAMPFFIEWYRLRHDDSTLELTRALYSSSQSHIPDDTEMMIKMELLGSQSHGIYPIEIIEGIASLPDANFSSCLNFLGSVFEDSHKDFPSGVLEGILKMLLENAMDKKRGELTRVQCLDFFGDLVVTSRTCKEIAMTGRGYLFTVIATCLSQYQDFPDLYREARTLMKRIVTTNVGEAETVACQTVMKSLLRDWQQDPFVCSAFIYHLTDIEYWPVALQLAEIPIEVVRWNAVHCLIGMRISHCDDPKANELFSRTLALLRKLVSEPNSRSFQKLYQLVYGDLPPQDNEAIIAILIASSQRPECTKTLELCAGALQACSDDVAGKYAHEIVELGLARLRAMSREEDLGAVGRCMSYLSSEEQAQVMELLCRSEFISLSPFQFVVEGLSDENFGNYTPRIFEIVLAILKTPFDVYEIPARAGEARNEKMEYMKLNDKYAVYSREDIQNRVNVLDLVACMLDCKEELCLPRHGLDAILAMVYAGLSHGYDVEIRRAALQVMRGVIAGMINAKLEIDSGLVTEVTGLLATEYDFQGMQTLVGILLLYNNRCEVPDDVFESIMKALVTVSVNLHRYMCMEQSEDNYEDGWTTECLEQLVESINELFDDACEKAPELACQCIKAVLGEVPSFTDSTVPWVSRAMCMYLWSAAINGCQGFQVPDGLPEQLSGLLSDDHPYIRQTAVFCLSNVIQNMPFSNVTLQCLKTLMEFARSGDTGSEIAVGEIGEVICQFIGKVDVTELVGEYVSLIDGLERSEPDQVNVYEGLLKLVETLANSPGYRDLASDLVKKIVVDWQNGKIGGHFAAILEDKEQESPIIAELLRQLRWVSK